jgi:hypothetical protein
MDGPTNVDRRLGDATKIALKANFVAWIRPEKPMEGLFRANYLAGIFAESFLKKVLSLKRAAEYLFKKNGSIFQ